ncbi:MAG: NAD(P)/FAD-dependent oxidoreductase, partial [Saprospiraceae bacterium]
MESSRKRLDFLIVGQGLAGTLLSHFLLKENQRIMVIDQPVDWSSSRLAAGIINPVTGRRLVKSWRFEEFYPFAKGTYRELESLLGISIWHERNILRALPTVFDENEWLRRSAFEDYRPFIKEEVVATPHAGMLRPVRAWGLSQYSVQVAMPQLVSAFRAYLQQRDILLEEQFDFQALEIQPDGVEYQGLLAGRVVFCEGSRAVQNPFFNYLPFAVTKGELLLVKIPGASIEEMVKHHLFLVPLEDGIYWAGATSRFEFDHGKPEEEKRQWLENQLRKILEVPFEVVAHRAGIRPT